MKEREPREVILAGDAVSAIEGRMLNGAEFTFGGLVDRYGKDHYRTIDKAIQRLRKAGKITKRREGRSFVWKAAEGCKMTVLRNFDNCPECGMFSGHYYFCSMKEPQQGYLNQRTQRQDEEPKQSVGDTATAESKYASLTHKALIAIISEKDDLIASLEADREFFIVELGKQQEALSRLLAGKGGGR